MRISDWSSDVCSSDLGSLEEFDLSELRPMIAINYESIVRSCYLFARAMKAAGSGQIINVSSIGANITAAGVGVYGGLKRALEMLTGPLRSDLAGNGGKVGLVCPGPHSIQKSGGRGAGEEGESP